MSGRRRFGSVVSRTSRDGKRRYVEARYQPPVWAYAKWPDLPKHYSRRFDADYTAMAAAWLADVERHIRLGDWEPPRNRGEQDEGDGGNIIGAILAGHDGRRSRIYHTAVHPEARGMGVGSLLAGHAVEALRALGLPKVAVGVYADNKAGNDFWEQQGFAIRDDLVYRELSL